MAIQIKIAEANDNPNLEKLGELINAVYLASEANIWKSEHRRVSLDRLTEIFNKGELIIAKEGESIVGCIHLEPINTQMFKFKMLAVDFDYKRKGIGGMLVAHAEEQARKQGAEKMQLELLVPEQVEHPDKVILEKWYTGIGYKQEEIHGVDYCHCGMSADLSVPCQAVIYRKALI